MTTQAETILSLITAGLSHDDPEAKAMSKHIQMVTEVKRPDDDTTSKADSMHLVGFEDMSVLVMMYEGNDVVGAGCPPIGSKIHMAAIQTMALDAMERIVNKASAEFEA